ncbi:hypothetical protein DB30_01555 [Enhygromyxa salina]|uniref:Endo-1,4-beta-xylanase A n=1 Tax=Enhygromyxa salina TaxID=215803 RepID=A0A0C1Z3V7_9BACT|nr:hypothetical protein [Enhygromyxa salina]KIG12364.1 hypothetical protein DB30_01555 [Enhygromyxa salina]
MPAHRPSLVCVAVFGLALAACVDRAGSDELGSDDTGDTSSGDGDGEGDGDTDTDTDRGDGDGDTGDGDGDGDADTEETDTGEPLPEGFCDESCAVLSPDGCLTPDACLTYCEEDSLGWDPVVGEAFAACAATNPLCFQSVEGCMLAALHPEGSPIGLRVDGAGFDAQEGRAIRVWADVGAQSQLGGEALVANGGFSVEWVEFFPIFDVVLGPLVMAYIDVDDDGSCDGDVDVTVSVHSEWNGDFLDPVFEVSLVAPLDPAAFVCDFVP